MNDSDGIVDEYILYLLNSMMENLNELVIVVNGMLQMNDAKKLEEYTSKIFYRSNDGYDAIAYKQTITEFLGMDYIRQFDEVVLFNDTFFGPFYPFKIVFHKMEKENVDFWGLTKHAEYRRIAIYMPEHIQSYFLVIRKKMLNSMYFEEFWNSLNNIGIFQQLVVLFEIHFTNYFSKKGFTYTAYIKDDELNSNDPYCNFNHYAYISSILLKEYGMPILKRKDFVDSKNISMSIGYELQNSLEWIKSNTNYDVEMIWKNVIRKYNVADLKKNLNLTYVLPAKEMEKEKCDIEKSVVIAYLSNEKQIEKRISYLLHIPEEIDILVITNNENIYKSISLNIERAKCILTLDYGKEFGFITACKNLKKDYRYLCFVHDENIDVSVDEFLEKESVNTIVWENTLGTPEYIENVLFTLEKDKNLGVLSVPEPLHSNYVKKRIVEWEESYSAIQNWAKRIGINCKLDIQKRAFTFSSAFWCKTEAIKKIVEYPFSEENFREDINKRCIKYLLTYAAQDAGYYSGIVETTNFSRIELENQNIFIDDYMYKNILKKKIAVFARQYEKVFVYGAGYEARKVKSILGEFGCPIESFAVSDSHYSKTQLITDRIIPVSKVPNDDKTGIIVAMNTLNTYEAKQFLLRKNYKNIFYINE